MMNLNYLREVCRAKAMDLGSTLNDEIQAIYDFAAEEVEAGESEHHEVELALDALDELTDNTGE